MTTATPAHAPETLTLRDPATGRAYHIPATPTPMLDADVAQRWVANVIVPDAVARALVAAPFLEPERVGGRCVLSLCAIFMRHAAPSWAPLAMGPASHNAALRVACRDTRDGSPAVWVDHRFTDSCFAVAVRWLGFAPVRRGLRHRCAGMPDRPDTLAVSAMPGDFDLRLGRAASVTASRVFDSTHAFEEHFTAGIRSYGPAEGGRFTVVDLVKRSNNRFIAMPYRGQLATPHGAWDCDSVYRTRDGRYRWFFRGFVDRDGGAVDG